MSRLSCFTIGDKPGPKYTRVETPARVPAGDKLQDWLVCGTAALVLLHVAAALKHQFINRDGTLRRMIG